jgi:3-dehydroquinate synthetase
VRTRAERAAAVSVTRTRAASPRAAPSQDLAAWRGLPKSSTIVLVTDANVWRWHGRATLAAFAVAGVTPAPLVKVLPPGEPSKTRATKEAIEDWMLANK